MVELSKTKRSETRMLAAVLAVGFILSWQLLWSSPVKMISGLLKPTTGKIDTNGNTIAYMPEYTVPYKPMSGREFLLFPSVLYDLDPVSSRLQVEEYLEI